MIYSNLSMIVAMAQNHTIGNENKLLFYLPNDLKRFKRITTGHAVIMGRKTFESLPNGALPNRRNIVITAQQNASFEGCETVHTVEEAIEAVHNEEEAFVIGGGTIYNQFYPRVSKIYLTMIHQDFEGDTFFPELNFTEWNVVLREDLVDERNNFSYSNIDLQRS
jgi:dihydrofolate reductase